MITKNEVKKLNEIHDKIELIDHELYLEENSGLRNNPYAIKRLIDQREILLDAEAAILNTIKQRIIYE